MTTMDMNVGCEDVRREIAASAPDAPLSPGARAHLAGCDGCGLALADAALAAAPPEPAAVEPPAKLLDLAVPLAAADARGFGWLFAGTRLGPRVLAIVVVIAFAVLIRADAIVQRPLPIEYDRSLLWRPVYGDLADGLVAVSQVPGALPFLKQMLVDDGVGDLHPASLDAPDAKVVEGFFGAVLGRDSKHLEADTAEIRRIHAALPAGPAHGAASRFLVQILASHGPRSLGDLMRTLFRDAKPAPGRDLDELVWLGAGLRAGLFQEPERAAHCERMLLLRWRLVRTYGRHARSDAVLPDLHCDQHHGHASPQLIGSTTELVGSLAAGHMLHAWNAGWPAVAAALADPDWRVPNTVWLFRSTIPGLAGCAAFLALWMLALALRRRAAIGAALAHEPDGGARPLLALALALSPCLAAMAVAGGLFWIACAFVFHALDLPLMGNRHFFPRVDLLVDLVFYSEIRAFPARGELALRLAVWFAAVGALVRVHLAALRWLAPDSPLRVRDVLIPLGAVLLLALPPAPFRPPAIAQPVVLAVAMALAMRWLRRSGSASERRLAAMTATAAAGLLLTNSGATISASTHRTYPVLSGVIAALVVVLPGVTGYVLAHLPAGTWRAQRMLAAGAAVFTPLMFASFSVRGTLAWFIESPAHASWTPALSTCAALLVMAAASLALGARLAPPGAAAFRDPSPPAGPIPRLLARLEPSRAAIALWLIAGWLAGHLGVLAIQLNLI